MSFPASLRLPDEMVFEDRDAPERVGRAVATTDVRNGANRRRGERGITRRRGGSRCNDGGGSILRRAGRFRMTGDSAGNGERDDQDTTGHLSCELQSVLPPPTSDGGVAGADQARTTVPVASVMRGNKTGGVAYH